MKLKAKAKIDPMSNSQLALQAEIAAFNADWQDATDSLIRTSGSYIKCGETLLRIKDITKLGEFQALFTGMVNGKMGTGQLPCSQTYANHLMRIARQPLFKKHLPALPGSMESLNHLAQLAEHSADAFEKHVKAGDIHPHMTERDIRKLMGKPAYNAGRVKERAGAAMLGEPGEESKAKEQFMEDNDVVDRASLTIKLLQNIPGTLVDAPASQLTRVAAAIRTLSKELAKMQRALKKGKKARGKKAA